jgi:hypothetical protein
VSRRLASPRTVNPSVGGCVARDWEPHPSMIQAEGEGLHACDTRSERVVVSEACGRMVWLSQPALPPRQPPTVGGPTYRRPVAGFDVSAPGR